MNSIYFMKIETHSKLSFNGSDFWPPILPASTPYTKDGAKRRHNFRHSVFRHFFKYNSFSKKDFAIKCKEITVKKLKVFPISFRCLSLRVINPLIP
jgi:hypothetical protein